MLREQRNRPKFHCRYTLDERVDRELANLTQKVYRSIQSALEPTYYVKLVDGMPDPVQYYLLYSAALIYGASDALVTLVLHNLGREARLLERQIFEYWVRSVYYASNPVEAEKALYSTPFREKEILDELDYDKTSKRYQDLTKLCSEVRAKHPASELYREPKMSRLLLGSGDSNLKKFYALHYRVPSQIAHATHVGVGGVWDESGILFDSRLPKCNDSLEMTLLYLIAFVELLNKELELGLGDSLGQFKREREAVVRRLHGAGSAAAPSPKTEDG